MKKLIIYSLITLFALSGCSYFAYQYQTGAEEYAKTQPEDIKIYSGDIERDYTVIGSVTADVMGDGEAAAKYLKKKAAFLGADAIIHTKLTKLNSYSARTGISGVAVKLPMN